MVVERETRRDRAERCRRMVSLDWTDTQNDHETDHSVLIQISPRVYEVSALKERKARNERGSNTSCIHRQPTHNFIQAV